MPAFVGRPTLTPGGAKLLKALALDSWEEDNIYAKEAGATALSCRGQPASDTAGIVRRPTRKQTTTETTTTTTTTTIDFEAFEG